MQLIMTVFLLCLLCAQVLYEFVFSSGCVGRKFIIFQQMPKTAIFLSSDLSLSDIGITTSRVLVVESSEDDVMDMLDANYDEQLQVLTQND